MVRNSPPEVPHDYRDDRFHRAAAKNEGPLSPELLDKMDAYWRAANYLSVGQIYLKDNPLLNGRSRSTT